jgi:hypothetical protein
MAGVRRLSHEHERRFGGEAGHDQADMDHDEAKKDAHRSLIGPVLTGESIAVE